MRNFFHKLFGLIDIPPVMLKGTWPLGTTKSEDEILSQTKDKGCDRDKDVRSQNFLRTSMSQSYVLDPKIILRLNL